MFQVIRSFRDRRSAANRRLTTFRPKLLILEGRITPANATWVGNGVGQGALWSVPANWNTNAVPGPNDVAILDARVGIGANTNLTMDLGGVGSYHVGKLLIQNGYTSTITLNSTLVVDILDMRSAATIKQQGTTQKLEINQVASDPATPATMFGTSFWKSGTIETAQLLLTSENAHRLTLEISPATSVALKSEMKIQETYSTVNWISGDVVVEKGKKVINEGTFLADSKDKSFGTTDPNDKWTFENWGNVIAGNGRIANTTIIPKLNGAVFDKVKKGGMEQPNQLESEEDDVFEIVGDFIQDPDAQVIVEGGTLKITGTVTQSAGSVMIADGATMEVTGDYALSGGTVVADGVVNDTLLSVGAFIQSGGEASIQYSTLAAAGAVTVSGGTLALLPATINAGDDINIETGGTLRGIGAMVINGTLINAGTITVGGIQIGGPQPVGTLFVTGDYTQTGTGILNLALYDSTAYDTLDVSGLATLDGTLNVTLLPGAAPSPSDVFEVVTYGTRVGEFETVNLPSLPPGSFWEPPNYDDPMYPNALSLWIDMEA
jgi:hypothetical protein